MTQFEITEGSVNDYFTLENLLFSSRTADAYRGVDLERQIAVTVWLSRGQFGISSPRMNGFIQRLRYIAAMNPPVADIDNYGIDSAGMGFLVMPTLDGGMAVAHVRDAAEVERRFIRILRLVDRLHASGVVLGDLGQSSFWLNRSGEVSLITVFGPDPGEHGERAQTISAEAAAFCAPEILKGENASFRSDVYSLGALCHYLITGTAPDPDRTGSGQWLSPASGGSAGTPVWAEEILAGTLNPSPGARFPDAASIMRTLMVAKDRSLQDSSLPSKRGPILLPEKSQQQMLVRNKPKPPAEDLTGEPLPEQVTPSRWKVKALLCSGILLASLVGLFLAGEEGEKPAEEVQKATLHQNVEADRPLKEAMREAEVAAQDVANDREKLKSLTASNDPLAHDTLVRLAVASESLAARRKVEEAIIERARRLGAIRCAEEVRTWLQGIEGALPEIYETILRALDQTLPQDAIERYLRQAYPKAPSVVLKLTAALGFDSREINRFQPLLAQLIGDNLKLDSAREHSAQALILADPFTAATYADDVIQDISKIPDGDIFWLLDLLAVRHDPNIKVVAHTAIERNLLPPGKRVFGRLLRDRDDLSTGLSMTLVNAISGKISDSDISQIGNWYDVESEAALLGIMAISTDPHTRTEAFDTVASKVKQNALAAAMVERIRTRFWEQRADLAHLVGVIAYADEFSDEQIAAAINEADGLLRQDNKFLDIFLTSTEPRLIRVTVSHFASSLGAGRLINLLSFPDSTVKIAAINMLKDYNQVQLLQLIIEAYKREKDPVVKDAYREAFWFIKERETQGSL